MQKLQSTTVADQDNFATQKGKTPYAFDSKNCDAEEKQEDKLENQMDDHLVELEQNQFQELDKNEHREKQSKSQSQGKTQNNCGSTTDAEGPNRFKLNINYQQVDNSHICNQQVDNSFIDNSKTYVYHCSELENCKAFQLALDQKDAENVKLFEQMKESMEQNYEELAAAQKKQDEQRQKREDEIKESMSKKFDSE